MEIFSYIPIRWKLLLILIFPLVGLLYFSYLALQQQYHTYREVKAIEDLSGVALASSALVHELQMELGLSTYYISEKKTPAPDAPEDRQSPELPLGALATEIQSSQIGRSLQQQRIKTDVAIEYFVDTLNNIDVVGFSEDFEAAAGWAQGRLLDMAAMREDVEKRAAKPDPTKRKVNSVLNNYGYVNDLLLDVISATTRQSKHANISAITAAYVNFLHSKDQVALELAILNTVFAKDFFDKALYPKLIEVLNEEKTYQKVFFSFADENQLRLFQEAVFGEYSDDIMQMKKIALERATKGGFGVDVANWFTAMGGQLKLLKEVEERLKFELSQQVASLKSQTERALAVIVAVIIMTIAIVLTLSLGGIRVIQRQLLSLHDTMYRTANDSDLTRRVEVISKDEVGRIAADLNNLLVKLTQVVQQIDRVSLRLIVAANNTSFYSNKISENTTLGYIETELLELLLGKIKGLGLNRLLEEHIDDIETGHTLSNHLNKLMDGIDKIEALHKNTTEKSIALESFSHELREMSLQLQRLVKEFHV